MMMKSCESRHPLHLQVLMKNFITLCLLLLCLSLMIQKGEALNKKDKKVSGVYVFGDSTVDPGNNNFIKTAFKSNFPPYGIDFPNQQPTGRFCNGKLGTDFVASYLGVKELVPPYLDPKLSVKDLMTGVSFASAGTGFDILTSTVSNVIPIPKQLEYFKECKKRMESVVGKQGVENHIKEAVFFISAGTNDFVVNYFTLPIRRKSFTLLAYQHFVLHNEKEFIQGLWEEGARKILVAGLPPMGCLPIMITLNSDNAFLQRGCLDQYSSVGRDYNLMLQHQLHLLQLNFSTLDPNLPTKISYVDTYEPLFTLIQHPQTFGFEEVNGGCCGSGYVETAILCNKMSYVCPDASKYVFWDSIHPTEKAYYELFLVARPTIDALVNS